MLEIVSFVDYPMNVMRYSFMFFTLLFFFLTIFFMLFFNLTIFIIYAWLGCGVCTVMSPRESWGWISKCTLVRIVLFNRHRYTVHVVSSVFNAILVTSIILSVMTLMIYLILVCGDVGLNPGSQSSCLSLWHCNIRGLNTEKHSPQNLKLKVTSISLL